MDRGGFLSGTVSGGQQGLSRFASFWRLGNSRRYPLGRVPRGVGAFGAGAFLCASLAAGLHYGGHYERFVAENGTPKDVLARVAGFSITEIGIAGHVELTQAEVLGIAGIAPTTSLLFLDPVLVQQRLKAVPLVSEARVTKLYPDKVMITLVERVPYALWQHDGVVEVISEDGTPVETLSDPRFFTLPHVVGPDANMRVREFVALMHTLPQSVRDQVRAGVLVSQRRWTLKLHNGVDVKLPEGDPRAALKTFAALESAHSLSQRGVLAIDMRVPDRVDVRLTEEAASQYRDGLQVKIKKWGGKA